MKTRYTIMQALCALAVAGLLAPPALAELPPKDPAAQAKAAAAAVKAAWSAKVAAYQLCQVQDRVAAAYRSSAAASGKPAPTPVATPACADPGPFVTAQNGSLEAAGAHSPAAAASAAPVTQQPAAAAPAPAPKQ